MENEEPLNDSDMDILSTVIANKIVDTFIEGTGKLRKDSVSEKDIAIIGCKAIRKIALIAINAIRSGRNMKLISIEQMLDMIMITTEENNDGK